MAKKPTFYTSLNSFLKFANKNAVSESNSSRLQVYSPIYTEKCKQALFSPDINAFSGPTFAHFFENRALTEVENLV
jgi:hypothetical protein